MEEYGLYAGYLELVLALCSAQILLAEGPVLVVYCSMFYLQFLIFTFYISNHSLY